MYSEGSRDFRNTYSTVCVDTKICNLLQKGQTLGSENSGGMAVLKSGRRRWGQMVTKNSDSWDELDPSETAASTSKKPSLGNIEEERSPKEQRPQWVL